MRAYPQLSIVHPRTTLSIAVIVMLSLAAVVAIYPRLDVAPSFESAILANDPDRGFHARAREVLGDDAFVIIAVEADAGVFTPETLGLVDRISRRVEALDGVRAAYSHAELGDLRGGEAPRDDKVAGITVELVPGHADGDLQGELAGRIVAIASEEAAGAKGARVHVAGLPIMSRAGSIHLLRDLVGFGAAVFLGLLVIVWFVSRHVQAMVFTALVMSIGVLGTCGAMAVSDVRATLWFLSGVVFVMALGVTYSMYVGYAYIWEVLHEREHGRSLRDHRYILSESVRKVRDRVLFASVVLCIGFLSMLASPVPDLARLGLFLAVGTATVTLAALTVVPAVLAWWPFSVKDRARHNRWTSWLVGRVSRSTTGAPRLHPLSIAALVTLGGVAAATTIDIDTDAVGYFQESSAVYQDEQFVRRHLGGTSHLRAVVVGPPDAFQQPENRRRLEEVADYAETLPHVTKAVGQLRGASSSAGRDDGWASVGIRMDTMSSGRLEEVEAKLERFMAERFPGFEVNVVGTVLMTHRAFDTTATSMLYSLAIACGAIFLVMVLAFRSAKLAILAFICSCLPMVLGVGILGLIARPLDPSVAVAGGIVLGISVAGTICLFTAFLARRKYFTQSSPVAVEEMLAEVGRPVLLSSWALAPGFGIMVFSSHGALVGTGLALCITAATTLVVNLLVTPAVLSLTKIERPEPRESDIELLGKFKKLRADAPRKSFDDYTDEEILSMFTGDFLALSGKRVIRQGGLFGTRRLFYELEIKPGMKVLEIGTGVGASAFDLAEHYDVHVTSVDLSAYMVSVAQELARERGLEDRITIMHVTDGDHYPFEDDTFDIVLVEAIVMYANPDSIFSESYRLLKPGGRIGFHDWSWPQKPDRQFEELTCVLACGCNLGDIRIHSKAEWRELLEKWDFRTRFSEEYPFNFFALSGMRDDEGTIGVIKMFARVFKRRATIVRMMRMVMFLARNDGAFSYTIIVGEKQGSLESADAGEAKGPLESVGPRGAAALESEVSTRTPL